MKDFISITISYILARFSKNSKYPNIRHHILNIPLYLLVISKDRSKWWPVLKLSLWCQYIIESVSISRCLNTLSLRFKKTWCTLSLFGPKNQSTWRELCIHEITRRCSMYKQVHLVYSQKLHLSHSFYMSAFLNVNHW